MTIRLEPVPRGTRLHLAHEFADAAVRDEHVQGWRYQLSLFANVVTDDIHRDAAALVDAWFTVWAEPDAAPGAPRRWSAIATADVRMRDRFSSVDGVPRADVHIGAAQRFMPGLRLQREGDARHCQGTVLADWTAIGPDEAAARPGNERLHADRAGMIDRVVTGFWG